MLSPEAFAKIAFHFEGDAEEVASASDEGTASSAQPQGGSGLHSGIQSDSAAPAAGGASTLFERMANLSRNSGADEDEVEDDEDGDDDAPALSIPRFLGRQNNQ